MDYRNERMDNLIVNTFFNCLETEDFSTITIGKLCEAAKINRSTFYRHFEDKYQLRDHIIDELVSYFVNWLEVDFLDMDIAHNKNYSPTLKQSLESIFARKREMEILWQQHALGRNLFEEMIFHGAKKIETAIRKNATISTNKKKFADWYAKLLVNNMLVSIRWWFEHCSTVTSTQMTNMMQQHMIMGTIPTLKNT